MSKFKKKEHHQNITSQAPYLQSSNTGLPENYTIDKGFLFKGDTPVSLVTSGIVETAVQDFLHVDQTEKYKTK